MINQRRPDPAPAGGDAASASPSLSEFATFTADLEATGDTAVLRLAGELDLAVEERMRDALDALLASPAETVVVDLRALAYMDSTGVQRLLAAQVAADESGRRMRVLLGDAARRILVLCGVVGRFTEVR
jgi:anti-anti-sigma factor